MADDSRDDAPERTPDQPSGEDAGSKTDRLLVHAVSEEGKVAHVIRQRGDSLELGRMQPLEHGKPIAGEVVELKQRPELPLLYDVDVKVESPLPQRRHPGPPAVATEEFRRGWELIWGATPDDLSTEGEEEEESPDDELLQ